MMRPSSILAPALLAAALLLPAGCGGGRTAAYTPETAPQATLDAVTVRVDAVESAADALRLDLTIANPTAAPVVIARTGNRFAGVTLVVDDRRIAGQRIPPRRTTAIERYTVLPGETASLRLAFPTGPLAPASGLRLEVAADTAAGPRQWAIPITTTAAIAANR